MNNKERAWIIDALGSALADGETSLGQVPQLLRKVLENDAWKQFETKMGKVVAYDRFEDFVTTPPLAGLGASMDIIKRIVAEDPVTMDLLDRTLQRPTGRPQKTVDNVNKLRPSGNSAESALRKLRKDRPDLHARVLSGELSPHKAMIEAGFRPRTVTINISNPSLAASSLLKQVDPAFIQDLIRELTDNTSQETHE